MKFLKVIGVLLLFAAMINNAFWGVGLGAVGLFCVVAYLLDPTLRKKVNAKLKVQSPNTARNWGLAFCGVFFLGLTVGVVGLVERFSSRAQSRRPQQPLARAGGTKLSVRRIVKKRQPRMKLIPFRVLENRDSHNPVVTKIIRVLVIGEGHSSTKVRQLLRMYYANTSIKLRGTSGMKRVWMYVYDSAHRYKRGAGEHIAMLQEAGMKLATWPSEITLRVPLYKNAPSKRKLKIYEALQDALHVHYKGSKESYVNRKVARRFRISKKKLSKIWAEVYSWRHAKNK